MKKPLGIILIIAALFAGYLGINELDDSGGSVKFLGITIRAEDEGAKQKGYVYLGIAVIALVGGVALLRKGGE